MDKHTEDMLQFGLLGGICQGGQR